MSLKRADVTARTTTELRQLLITAGKSKSVADINVITDEMACRGLCRPRNDEGQFRTGTPKKSRYGHVAGHEK